MAETGRYMYAVCRDLDPAALADFPGLGGGRLDLVEYDGLVAVVSTVSLDEYGEEGLRANLEDLEWLEEAARRHDAVIQAVAVAAPTAPMRLATICLDDDGVRKRLQEWHAALTQVLDRVQGRTEWSVKVFTELEPAAPVSVAAEAPATGAGSGAAYLQRKKAETEAQTAGQSAALAAAEHVHEALTEQAVAARRLPAQDPRLTGHEGTMVHNGAYLVDVGDEPGFVALTERLQAIHPDVLVDVRGPWPPYSFAMLEQR